MHQRPSTWFMRCALILGLATVPAPAAHAQSAREFAVPAQSEPSFPSLTTQPGKTLMNSPDTAENSSWNIDSLIGVDDLLDVTVFEAPEMNETARVSAAGDISMPLLGAVPAAGFTARELESVIQGMLRNKFMKDPHVGVFVHELQSHAVSVVGAVKSPGTFQIREAKSLLEVLSMAGGLADDAGDKVIVTSASMAAPAGDTVNPAARPGSAQSVDLKALLNSADSTLNLLVRPGDIVKVPLAGIVYVVGEVNKPGGFVLQNNEKISVLQALALAQGLTHTSAMHEARIIRTDPLTGARREIPMDLRKISAGKAPDQVLEPKDIVFVPNSAAKSLFFRGSEAALQTAAGVAIYKW